MGCEVDIVCACGAVRGRLHDAGPSTGVRSNCYCADCQAYAHFLGCADTVLDGHGGTDIYLIGAGHLELTAGTEQLACVRLTPGGPQRWYAQCCNTPIANLGRVPGIAFVGMIRACWDAEADRIGPSRGGIHARTARGDRTALYATDGMAPAILVRVLVTLVVDRLRGRHRCRPFADPDSGRSLVAPRQLGPAEYQALLAATSA